MHLHPQKGQRHRMCAVHWFLREINTFNGVCACFTRCSFFTQSLAGHLGKLGFASKSMGLMALGSMKRPHFQCKALFVLESRSIAMCCKAQTRSKSGTKVLTSEQEVSASTHATWTGSWQKVWEAGVQPRDTEGECPLVSCLGFRGWCPPN